MPWRNRISASKGENLSLELGTIHGEDIGGDDDPRAAPNPADRGGTRNVEVTKQERVALFADEVAHPVVVGKAAGGGRHGACDLSLALKQPSPA
jgi:hypothetical protein